jgi:phosphoribosylaminoimidazole-succinocarboxamide synthase
MTSILDIASFPVTYTGSVKTIREVSPFSENKMGEAIFEFTDDSSVKDYGKLPFTTPFKGEDLCAMATQSFKDLERLGIPTIFKEQIASNAMLVDYVRVINPRDVNLSKVTKNRLVPLECIIRHIITSTSSAHKRLLQGDLHPDALGLSKIPGYFPYVLPKMYLDGSTKLDAFDEYIPWEALKNLSKESVETLNQIDIYTRMIGQYSLKKGREVGLVINDFKVEWALDDKGELILADVPLAFDEITSVYVGNPYHTLDEFKDGKLSIFVPGKNHDLVSGVNVSKQIYRDHYNCAEQQWVDALEGAKNVRGSEFPKAPTVPGKLIELASDLFGGLRNLWSSDNKRSVPPLSKSVSNYKRWAREYYEEVG